MTRTAHRTLLTRALALLALAGLAPHATPAEASALPATTTTISTALHASTPAAAPSARLAAVTRITRRLPRGHIVARYAAAQRGDRYVFGATGPNTWDCSGLTQGSYRRVGRTLPHKAARQSGMGIGIPRRNTRPGDLVYWGPRGRAHHIGVVLSYKASLIADAPGRGRRVTVRPPFTGARYLRLL